MPSFWPRWCFHSISQNMLKWTIPPFMIHYVMICPNIWWINHVTQCLMLKICFIFTITPWILLPPRSLFSYHSAGRCNPPGLAGANFGRHQPDAAMVGMLLILSFDHFLSDVRFLSSAPMLKNSPKKWSQRCVNPLLKSTFSDGCFILGARDNNFLATPNSSYQ